MMSIIDGRIVSTRYGRTIVLARVEPQDRCWALIMMGHDVDTARVFGFGDAERGTVILLAQRKELITR